MVPRIGLVHRHPEDGPTVRQQLAGGPVAIEIPVAYALHRGENVIHICDSAVGMDMREMQFDARWKRRILCDGAAAAIAAIVLLCTALGEGVTAQTETGRVPKLIGLSPTQAERRLEGTGFTLLVERRDSAARRETIFDQFPGEGGAPGPDRRILVHVSDGLIVPRDLERVRSDVAATRLTELGFTVQKTVRAVCAPEDVVIEVVPVGGEQIDATLDPVTLIVSEIGMTTIPSDLPLSEENSTKNGLQAIGLRPVVVTNMPKEPDKNWDCRSWVFRPHTQISPERGTSVPCGSEVKIILTGRYVSLLNPSCGSTER